MRAAGAGSSAATCRLFKHSLLTLLIPLFSPARPAAPLPGGGPEPANCASKLQCVSPSPGGVVLWGHLGGCWPLPGSPGWGSERQHPFFLPLCHFQPNCLDSGLTPLLPAHAETGCHQGSGQSSAQRSASPMPSSLSGRHQRHGARKGCLSLPNPLPAQKSTCPKLIWRCQSSSPHRSPALLLSSSMGGSGCQEHPRPFLTSHLPIPTSHPQAIWPHSSTLNKRRSLLSGPASPFPPGQMEAERTRSPGPQHSCV